MSDSYIYQEKVKELMLTGHSVILQAPTGAGKTRAALTPFLDTFWDDASNRFPKKCVYAVPMRVLANQFNEETGAKAAKYERLFKRSLSVAQQTGEYREDPEFRADITFATIDQVLSGWLMAPYSLPYRLGNMNAGAFVGSYLIFDEFHLFDPDSTLPTTLQMLKTLKSISPFILMTATFSKEMLEKLARYLDAEAFLLTDEMLTDIPAQNKERRFYTAAAPMTFKNEDKRIEASETVVADILRIHQAQSQNKLRTLVVCNQVERAQAVYTALCQQKTADVTVRLLHSRFLKKDRQEIEKVIRREFGKDETQHTIPSLIVVATQVVEVGLDMSCATLHTELAPASSLLQRAGRCARYPGESGQVYVYPLDEKEYAPYHGTHAHQQCDLAWEWLQNNQDHHLTFADEQELINHAHTTSDNLILSAVFGAEYERQTQTQAVWRGEKDRGEIAAIIRHIPSVSIVVHSNPDQLIVDPFRADSFSLHPGTLQGKFSQWKERNDALDPGFDEGHLDWLIYKLVEDTNEEDTQGNRPIRYGFDKARSSHDLYSPLLVVNPALVGYSPELGLTLYPSEYYETVIPAATVARQRAAYSYKLESYHRHIELVCQAFVDELLPVCNAAAKRLERAYGWREGIVTEMAHLIMTTHDVGKLSTGWQAWAQQWQKAIGQGELTFPAAHTDYDPMNPAHRIKVGKRPTHAVESALASLPILQSLVASELEKYRPLLRAAFTAIARHHAPFSSQPGSYQLIPAFAQEIRATLRLLPERVHQLCQNIEALAQINAVSLPVSVLETIFINPRLEQDICCYMLLVRALRMADQKGTSMGSKG